MQVSRTSLFATGVLLSVMIVGTLWISSYRLKLVAQEVLSTSESMTEGSITDQPNGSPDAAQEAFQLAMRAIAGNYDEIKTAATTFEEFAISPSIERTPLVVSRTVVTWKGESLRSERYQREGSDWKFANSRLRDGNIWTTFAPKSKWASRKRTDQLGGFPPVDPRDFGGLSQTHGLLDQMRRSEATGVTHFGDLVEVSAKIVDAPRVGLYMGKLFKYTFDSTKNFLPVQVVGHYRDGSINVAIDLVYEEVIPNRSWVVREMTVKYFRQEAEAKSPASDSWNQLLLYRASGKIHVNEPLDDDFKPRLPPDVRIRDASIAPF